MNRWTMIVMAGAFALLSAGCKDQAAQNQAKKSAEVLSDPVRVVSAQPVSTLQMDETVEVTGDVTAGEDTNLSARIPGRLTAVYVKQGDSVTPGQLIATLDSTQLNAQLQQALAQLGSAQSAANQAQIGLTQAIRNANVGPTQSSTQVRQAQAQLRSARAQLEKALAGARPEERRQAEAQLAAAKQNVETAQKELARIETLVKEGAVAGNRLDQARNAYQAALAQFRSAEESVNIVQNAVRPEDIEVARSAVRQAEEGVRAAEAQKSLDPILKDQVEAAKAQVATARSQVQAAQAQVAIARESLADAQVKAPFTGRIADRPAQAGTVVAPGTPIARIIGGSGVYFTGQAPSMQVNKIRVGHPVSITIDAVPGRTFSGTVAAISPISESVGRLFDVRIQFTDGLSDVRPGLFARGKIVVNTVQNALTVPPVAIVRRGDDAFVFVVDQDKAKRLAVTTGLETANAVQVTGLPAGAMVVTRGQQSLSDGNKVRIEDVSASRTTGTGGG